MKQKDQMKKEEKRQLKLNCNKLDKCVSEGTGLK